MPQLKRFTVLFALVLAAIAGTSSLASAQPQRLALVVGQAAYETGQLPTAANDAGLVAQALTSAGFEVIQGRDLGGNDLRRLVRDFLDKAQALEAGSAVTVYLSGYGVQLEGENYLLPVDARIQKDVDVPLEGFRLSDLIRSLERTPAQNRIVIADMGRDYPLASSGAPIAKGLALVEPPSGFLIAFSSAPNIVAADGKGPYGAYASALVEMIRQPGLPLDEVFSRLRLRTHEETGGLQTPWHAANLTDKSFVFFEQAEPEAAQPVREMRRIADVPVEEAYAIAVERDTIQDYQDFLRTYPDHPLARRVTALLAARREALVWRRTLSRNTSEAYWTYLRRYPNGPHAEDCRRRLVRLAAPLAPPPAFEEVVYEDLPPPLPAVERVEFTEVVTIIHDAPPPPPPPIYLLPPRDYDDDVFVTIVREPPPPPPMAGILPIPVPIPVPVRARPPATFYQPIAPVTPRGAVAIPVAAPVFGALMGGEARGQRPTRAPRPQQPTLPDQPGLAAPIQPLRVSTEPAIRPQRAPRPGMPPQAAPLPRLPLRPIPLAGPQPGRFPPAQRSGLPGPMRPNGPAASAEAPRPVPPNGNTGIVPPWSPATAPAAGPRPGLEALPPAESRGKKHRPGQDDERRAGRIPAPVFPGAPVRMPPSAGPVPMEPRIGRPERPALPERAARPGRPAPERPEMAQPFMRPQPQRPHMPREEMARPAPAMERPAFQARGFPPAEAPFAQRPGRPAPAPAAEARPRPPMAQPMRPAAPPAMAQPRMAMPPMGQPPRAGAPEGGPHRNGHPQGCVPEPGKPCPRR